MTVLAIELHDAGLRVTRTHADGLLTLGDGGVASPGVACVEPRSIVTGMHAAAQTALHPLSTHTRFWDQLGTDPVATGQPRGPSRAAVAIAHLRHALSTIRRDEDDVVIAVPPHYDRHQLGVLVSVAKDVDLRLRGMVASPVCLDLDADTTGRVLVVDMSLHRTTLSMLDAGADRIEFDRSTPCAGFGLEAFRRQWFNAIGAEFVRKTRFDPLHDAATEQNLHDRLATILTGLTRDASVAVDLESGAHVHRVTITDALLTQAGQGLMFDLGATIQETIAAETPVAVLLNHDAAGVPGLRAMLRRHTTAPVRVLEPGAAARGLCRAWPDQFEHLAEPGVVYHTWRHRAAATTSPASPGATPEHAA